MNPLAILLLSSALAGAIPGEGNVDGATARPYPDLRKVWDFNDPATSRARFEALRDSFPGDANAGFRLEIETQIARSLGLEGDFAAAHAVLDTVERSLGGTPPVVQIRYKLERGRVFNSSGEPGEARPLFLEAWEEGRHAGEYGLAVDAAHMVAIVEKGKLSLEWNERAIAYAESSGDAKALDWLGSLYNNTGWSCHALGDHTRALELWRKALAWQQERNPDTDRERIARWTVGRGLRAVSRNPEALEMQQGLLADIEAKGLAQDGYVFEEIGECLTALGREREAAPWFAKAWDLLSKDDWLARNEPQRLARMKVLAGREAGPRRPGGDPEP